MADEGAEPVELHTQAEGSVGKWILLLLAVAYVAGSLYFLFNLKSRLDQTSKDLAASNAQIADLGKRMQAAEADDETLAQQIGMTKKELVAKSVELQRQQRASEERLAEQQKQQITAVNGKLPASRRTSPGLRPMWLPRRLIWTRPKPSCRAP